MSVRRCCGLLLLAVVGCCWLSLLTWSVGDAADATVSGTANALGVPGAYLATVLLKVFGLATAVVLMVPMLAGLHLLMSKDCRLPTSGLVFSPLAVGLLSGAMSMLPLAPTWPLPSGYGGAVGDTVADVVAGWSSRLVPDFGLLLAALVLVVAGSYALFRTIGLTVGATVSPAFLPQRDVPSRDAGSEAAASATEAEGPAFPFLVEALRPAAAASTSEPSRPIRTEPTFDDPPRQTVRPDDPAETRVVTDEPSEDPDDLAAFVHVDPVLEEESRQMAERFAPATAPKCRRGKSKAVEPAARGASTIGEPASEAAPRRSASGARHERPVLDMLHPSPGRPRGLEVARRDHDSLANALIGVLANYGVEGEIVSVRPGPVVTRYELQPVRGTKSARVIGLAGDIARELGLPSVRIANIPGRSAIGIELPNAQRQPVLLRQLLESDTFQASRSALPIALGVTIDGEPVIADLAQMPHLLLAGAAGSGKSVCLHAMILSMLYRHAPQDCRLVVIDPKQVDLSVYRNIPHLLAPVVTEPQAAAGTLGWLVSEMERRSQQLAMLGERSIDAFNSRVRTALAGGGRLVKRARTGFDSRTHQPTIEEVELPADLMARIVVVVDELADVMTAGGRTVEDHLRRLAQSGHTTGIHLVLATQRPAVPVVTEALESVLPARISFRAASKADSRAILDDGGAEDLLDGGDMLYASRGGQALRLHGPFVSDDETEAVATFLRQQGAPAYAPGLGSVAAAPRTMADDLSGHRNADPLFDEATDLVLSTGKASPSLLQRHLAISYQRASGLLEHMERAGLVSAPGKNRRRDVVGAVHESAVRPATRRVEAA